MEHAESFRYVKFITANDLISIYANPMPPSVDKLALARHFKQSKVWVGSKSLSLGDFAAMVSAHLLKPEAVQVEKGKSDLSNTLP